MRQLDLTQEARDLNLDLHAAVHTLDEPARQRAIAGWRARMLNEHVSARVFAALVSQMMNAGIPAARQEAVATMICDELRHGRMCAAVVLALGGTPVIDLPSLPPVPEHRDAPPLEGLLRNVLSISCLSETVAVAMLTAERTWTHPLLDDILKAILADEIRHARLGWSLLDDLYGQLTPNLCDRLSDYLAPAFALLRQTHLPGHDDFTAEEDITATPLSEPQSIFFDTVRDVIIPQLENHGFRAQRAWRASFVAPPAG